MSTTSEFRRCLRPKSGKSCNFSWPLDRKDTDSMATKKGTRVFYSTSRISISNESMKISWRIVFVETKQENIAASCIAVLWITKFSILLLQSQCDGAKVMCSSRKGLPLACSSCCGYQDCLILSLKWSLVYGCLRGNEDFEMFMAYCEIPTVSKW